MRVVRIVLIVLGWLLVALDILTNISMQTYHKQSGYGYAIGYQMGRHIAFIAGLLLFLFAYLIKRRMKRIKKEFEINSFLKD